MCSPIAAMGMQAVGTIVQSRAVKSQAEAQARAKEYEASMLEKNALFADQQAHNAVEIGAVEEGKVRRYGAQVKAGQKVAAATNGIRTDSGSPLDILAGTNEQIELDAATIRANAQQDRWAYGQQGQDYRNQAKLARMGAANSRAAGKWNSLTTLIGGASSISSKWADMKQ